MSTRKLYVPEDHRLAFEAMAALPPEGMRRLMDVVDSVSLDAKPDFDRAIADAKFADSQDWAAAIFSAYASRLHYRLSAEEMAADLVSDMDLAESAVDKLGSLLSSASLTALAKAQDLGTSFQNQMLTMRIVSDIRPVFDEAEIGAPIGAVVVNTLELAYEHDDQPKTIYINVTPDHIESMVQHLARARDKGRQLESLLESIKLRQFNVEG